MDDFRANARRSFQALVRQIQGKKREQLQRIFHQDLQHQIQSATQSRRDPEQIPVLRRILQILQEDSLSRMAVADDDDDDEWDFGNDDDTTRKPQQDLVDQDLERCPKLTELWCNFYDELNSYQDIPLSKEDAGQCKAEFPHFSRIQMIYLWRDKKGQNYLKKRMFPDFDQQVQHIMSTRKGSQFILYNQKTDQVKQIQDREERTRYHINLEIMRNILSGLPSQAQGEGLDIKKISRNMQRVLDLQTGIPEQVRKNFSRYKQDLKKMIA